MPSYMQGEMVYAGAVNHNGHLVHAYYLLDNRGVTLGNAQLHAQPIGSFSPGDVFSVTYWAEGARVLPDSAKLVRRHQHADDVAEWGARHSAVMGVEAAWTAPMDQSAFRFMDPAREAYRRLGEEGRGVLLAQMIRYVVS
jgi:hypothetical protein